jgi:hypothetical protein
MLCEIAFGKISYIVSLYIHNSVAIIYQKPTIHLKLLAENFSAKNFIKFGFNYIINPYHKIDPTQEDGVEGSPALDHRRR